jgi:long-chain acyl-CoA synthetase
VTTMLDPLRRAVQVGAGRAAVRCGDVEVTYGQTWDRCRRLVGALRRAGLRAGDRVAVVGPNCHRYLEIYQAVPGAGMVLVPLNQRHTAAELAYALEDSGAKLVFAGDGVDLPPDTAATVVDMGAGYEGLIAGAPEGAFRDAVGESTLAGLFYTGGTTGPSKGVMLTHGNVVANAMHFQAAWRFAPETRWLIVAPLFHLAGSIAVLATVWNAGRQIVLPAFDPVGALDMIERKRVTATLVVPTMLAALTDEQLARPRDVSSLALISHGGAPAATQTLRRAHEAFPAAELMHIYGATETAPIATVLPHEERVLEAPQARSCGQPAVGVEIAVADASGLPTATGTVGEVLVRGPNVMAGYWRKPRETAAAMTGGWYRTGDLGYLDGRAHLYLVDRVKDMIVTGGENVYSTEVEDVLFRHDAVLEAAVFGVPDERWGEAVHGVVVLRSETSEAELLQHCRDAIAPYKVPKRIELRSEPLPKSAAGKLLKRELRAPYWAGRATQVAGA